MILSCLNEVNDDRSEKHKHGTLAFPVAFYEDDLASAACPHHWHEEFEICLIKEGKAQVSMNGIQVTLPAGAGAFFNAETLHALRQEGAERCVVHSIVFHPELIGGNITSVFWADYVNPLIKNTSFRGCFLYQDEDWQSLVLRKAGCSLAGGD